VLRLILIFDQNSLTKNFLFSAHGVHLAVMDILYNTPADDEEEEEVEEAGTDQADATQDGVREDEEEIEMAGMFHLEEFPADEVHPDHSKDYHQLLQNIRTIVRHFK